MSKGDLRCIEGRLFRHDPQADDPDLETDVGECPDCSGDGCGDDGEPVAKVGRSTLWRPPYGEAEEDSLRERFDLMHKPAEH